MPKDMQTYLQSEILVALQGPGDDIVALGQAVKVRAVNDGTTLHNGARDGSPHDTVS